MFATDTDAFMQRMLNAQTLLAKNLDPTNFRTAIA